jgi:hypothetical protein
MASNLIRYTFNIFSAGILHATLSVIALSMALKGRPVLSLVACIAMHSSYNLWVIFSGGDTPYEGAVWAVFRLGVCSLTLAWLAWLPLKPKDRSR